MDAITRENLKAAARQWIDENEGCIEVFQQYISYGDAPVDAEDPEEWASSQGGGSDFAVGFTTVDVETEDGASGVALITVSGHSWEGLRVNLGGIFESEDDVIASIEEDAYIV